ncbi:Dopey, N-terminal-domain-containing protein [Butyriboletus roseoflavus]|nr:Dopey, N-terminal-domain-containing protein [Butyriboletus roseoflavus]
MDDDVDMDAPQISTLREDPTPPPPRGSKLRVKLLVGDKKAKRKSSSPSAPAAARKSIPQNQAEPQPKIEEEVDEEDEEDQLIDDDEPAPSISAPVASVSTGTKRKAPPKKPSRPRKSDKQDKEDKKPDEPREPPDNEDGQSVSAAALPEKPPPKKKAAPRRTTAASKPKSKAPPKGTKALAVPPTEDTAMSETHTITAPSSPLPISRAASPEPEEVEPPPPPVPEQPGESAHLPLPVYPLPSKPFPVQPPPKIGTGFAPVQPLDRSGAKVRQWRVANREIRGIAGGRWFARSWVGDKESDLATTVAMASASTTARVADSDKIAVPKSVTSISAPALGKAGKSKATRGSVGISAAPSRSGSIVPELHTPKAPSKMRNIITGPASEAGDEPAPEPPSDHLAGGRLDMLLHRNHRCSVLTLFHWPRQFSNRTSANTLLLCPFAPKETQGRAFHSSGAQRNSSVIAHPTSPPNVHPFVRGPFTILFCGRDLFSCAVFKEVHNAKDVWDSLHIVTNPDARTGRRGSRIRPPLKTVGETLGVPVHTIPEDKVAFRKWLPPPPFTSPPDSPSFQNVLITASFGRILPGSVLGLFPGTQRLNVHPSLLPAYRGPAPIQRMLMAGERETGVCVIEMGEVSRRAGKLVDAGGIYAIERMYIPEGVSFPHMQDILAASGGKLLVKVLRDMLSGNTQSKPQGAVTLTTPSAPPITARDSAIHFASQTALTVTRLERAIGHQRSLTVAPALPDGRGVAIAGLQVIPNKLRPLPPATSPEGECPGTAYYSRKTRSLVVKCAEGTWLSVERLQTQDRAMLEAKEWWNGVQGMGWDQEGVFRFKTTCRPLWLRWKVSVIRLVRGTMSAKTVAVKEADARSHATRSAQPSTKTGERAAAQQLFSSDPKYKKYTQQVEKCLNAFDNVHEWADCIAFLKQLLKTFQSYLQFKEIPYKLIVAKRLSQCLNPALPTGVHQRALDVYIHILSVLGTEGLKRDLPLWSSGLFPFFEYASTSVKPTLLNIYDTYYLPLQHDLRPVMKSFILALLPGLEEETGEFFDKVLGLLDRLSGTVSPVFFMQNLWLVMITMSSARGTALNFLSRRLPRLNADEDVTVIVGSDIGLMIRAFAAALEDDNLLVRRSALDMLLQTMRIDSAAIRRAQPEDATILMKAAIGVVLRRDLSLNRRLFTWLLGPDEKTEVQSAYLRQHALQLLSSTLKSEMFAPSGEYSESRPFKIFISLLDKWEIGSLLTEALIYDALKALRQHLTAESEMREDITMTASTLLEAAEPSILWKHLLKAILSAINSSEHQLEAISLTLFLLRSLPVQDEEVRSIHLPVIFAALMEALLVDIQEDSSRIVSPAVRECFILQDEILRHFPPEALQQRPKLTDSSQESTLSPLAFGSAFYGLEVPTSVSRNNSATPLVSVVEHSFAFSQICAQVAVRQRVVSSSLRTSYSRVLSLLGKLVEFAEKASDASLEISWNPSTWVSDVLDSLDVESIDFNLVDSCISILVSLQRSSKLVPKFVPDQRHVVSRMVKKLFRFLHQDFAIFHVRAVSLVWALELSTGHHLVESIIAQSMSSPEPRIAHDALEAFGVLWRLTDDDNLPGFRFKVPLMIVLETLKHDCPTSRRIGETWMRCSLRSYIRYMPYEFDESLPAVKIKGKEIRGYIYEQKFDQRYVHHLLEILHCIVQFGIFIAHSAPFDPNASFLDILIDLLSRFIQSEPKEQNAPTMEPLNTMIQSISIEILQAIIARGEVDHLTLETLEPITIGKLYLFVHLKRLDLQNKLLRILHSLISASITHVAQTNTEEQGSSEGSHIPGKKTYTVNPLLTHTLMDGIALPHNRPVQQHWLDFVLMAIPQFQPALQGMITPLADCVCRQLRSLLNDAVRANQPSSSSAITGKRLLVLGLANYPEVTQQDEDTPMQEKTGGESSGILGYVSNVFTGEPTSSLEDQATVRSPGFRSLNEGVRVLFAIWVNFIWTSPSLRRSEDDSLALIYSRTRVRGRRVLEYLFRAYPSEVLEGMVSCWDRDLHARNSNPAEISAFELVDILIASAHSAVHMICESITIRSSSGSERSRRYMNPDVSDVTLFKFLEQYLSRLEGPLALQVWGRFMQLAKDIASNIREFRMQVYLTLRCLCVLGDKVTQTTAMDDKRIKKDLQETFGKLLDASVTFVGRTTEPSSWIRRATKESLMNGRSSPAPRGVTDLKVNEKANSSAVSLQDNARPTWGNELPSQILDFVATTAVPNLRKFLVDNDRIASSCSNIVYYIINPALKAKSRPLDLDNTVVDIIAELTKLPPALKVWRASVSDILYDTRLFQSNSAVVLKWKPIIKALFDSDKSSFGELLGRIATAPSTNIFVNRENEMLVRSLNLRRLSLVLFVGEKNHFLIQLPSVQEKLVDTLRNVSSPIVQSEVFLCIRVLLCRLSPHNLTSFWPVILTELYRIFEQIIVAVPADESEDLPLVLSASKCLDLLLTLQTPEFQIHHWIFVTDTVDAVFRPDDWNPEAMFDQLAEIVGSLPIPDPRERTRSKNGHVAFPSIPASVSLASTAATHAMRRPMLNTLRQIDSVRDLRPFFSHVSISTYESVYASGGNVDWEAVEQGLLEDMFDGR